VTGALYTQWNWENSLIYCRRNQTRDHASLNHHHGRLPSLTVRNCRPVAQSVVIIYDIGVFVANLCVLLIPLVSRPAANTDYVQWWRKGLWFSQGTTCLCYHFPRGHGAATFQFSALQRTLFYLVFAYELNFSLQ